MEEWFKINPSKNRWLLILRLPKSEDHPYLFFFMGLHYPRKTYFTFWNSFRLRMSAWKVAPTARRPLHKFNVFWLHLFLDWVHSCGYSCLSRLLFGLLQYRLHGTALEYRLETTQVVMSIPKHVDLPVHAALVSSGFSTIVCYSRCWLPLINPSWHLSYLLIELLTSKFLSYKLDKVDMSWVPSLK